MVQKQLNTSKTVELFSTLDTFIDAILLFCIFSVTHNLFSLGCYLVVDSD